MAIDLKRRVAQIALSIIIILLLILAFDLGYGYWLRRHGMLATYDTPIQNLYVLCTAIDMYDSRYKTYPPHLPAMGPPPAGVQESRDFANLIDRDLAYGNRKGYTYRYQSIDRHGNGFFDAFEILADPDAKHPDKAHYFLNQTCVIRWEFGKEASAASIEKPGSVDPDAPGGRQ